MIYRFILALLFVATPISADVVPVRWGELGESTRLVLTLPNQNGWTVDRIERTLKITVPSATSFRLPQGDAPIVSRIAGFDMAASKSTLYVRLSCDCRASSFLLGNGLLAIDISGHVDLAEASLPPFAAINLSQPWHNPITLDIAPIDDMENRDLPPESGARSTLYALDNAVSTGLARATYQGFLEIDAQLSNLDDGPNVSTDILDGISVGVESQMRMTQESATSLPDVSEFSCKTVSATLSEAWQFRHSHSLERSIVMTQLAIDADELNQSGNDTTALAIFYVGQGFGVEALSALEQVDRPDDLINALEYIAKVLDSPTPPTPIGLENCEEDLAFWAFLRSSSESEEVKALDPRKLMLTFKLLPAALQSRTVIRFGEALARAGYESFQAELQSFENTSLAVANIDIDGPKPRIDFTAPAPPREILRTDLTERDLDPDVSTPNDPNNLTLELLDGLRVERRGSSAELPLLTAVLERRVNDGEFAIVLDLLLEAKPRLDPNTYDGLLTHYLGQSIDRMNDAQLLSFAFQSGLPDLPDVIRREVAGRLSALDVLAPGQFFEYNMRDNPNEFPPPATSESEESLIDFTLPSRAEISIDQMPSIDETEQMLTGSEAMRNAIETLIDDIN